MDDSNDWWADARRQAAIALPHLTDAQCREVLVRLFAGDESRDALLAVAAGQVQGLADRNLAEQARQSQRRPGWMTAREGETPAPVSRRRRR